MGDGQITQKRIAEPVPNVGAVRRIPVVVWEEIKPGMTVHQCLSTIRQKQRCGVSPIVREGNKIYMVFEDDR